MEKKNVLWSLPRNPHVFICEKDKRQTYIAYMETLKVQNRTCREKRQELILLDWNQQIRKKSFLCSLRIRLNHLKSTGFSVNSQKSSLVRCSGEVFSIPNYFSEQRIAVYTCIIGAYDHLTEPQFKPNNIDYYVITDQSVPSGSAWSLLDISHIKNELSHFSAIEKNRWYKMHPHLLFPDYNYSLYLDGNIRPFSDLTECINRIGSCGIATHCHYMRDCVYQEAQAIFQRGKDVPERIKSHFCFLEERGMPKGYGLADCSVIARRHHDTFCMSLMDQWWQEFLAHSRRDQLSFPYVLFKNSVPMKDVTTLGLNRNFNDALDVTTHIQESGGR